MFDLSLVTEIKNGIRVKENMSKLYFENLNLIHTMANSMYLTDSDREDFLQMAYIALDKAVHVFKFDSGYSFLAYYRRCLVHEFYQHILLMRYPYRVTHKEHQHLKIHGDGLFFHYDTAESLDLTLVDTGFKEAEYQLLCDSVWNTVRSELNAKNYHVIVKLYKEGQSRREIANEMRIGYERVRLREIRSLQKLRRNSFLHELAMDYYGI